MSGLMVKINLDEGIKEELVILREFIEDKISVIESVLEIEALVDVQDRERGYDENKIVRYEHFRF